MLAGGVSPLLAQSIACMVNGEPITSLDIEQRTKLNFLTTRKQMSRQEVIDELTNEKVKIKEAKRFGVDPSASDVDQAYTGMSQRMRLSPSSLPNPWRARVSGRTALKSRLKAEMVWGSLVRGRFKESLQVGEKDVAAAAQEGGEPTQTEAFEYKLQPIVLIVPRGSAPAAVDLRRKEAETVRERVQTCEQANSYFKSMQMLADADGHQDLGRHSGPLRELLDKTPIGRLTPPEITKQGVEMVALCDRKPTKIDTPKKREIREKMFAQKYEAKKQKSYLNDLRKAAMIECR